ncbi:hypothetical protein ACW7G2_08015 [Luteimonas sp. A277]
MDKMGIFAQLSFGNALTKLTNFEEELADIRKATGAAEGDDIEMLPSSRQRELERKIPKWIGILRSQPEQVVTRELMKNMQLNLIAGRTNRVEIQELLLKRLVALGIAMEPKQFASIYLRQEF